MTSRKCSKHLDANKLHHHSSLYDKPSLTSIIMLYYNKPLPPSLLLMHLHWPLHTGNFYCFIDLRHYFPFILLASFTLCIGLVLFLVHIVGILVLFIGQVLVLVHIVLLIVFGLFVYFGLFFINKNGCNTITVKFINIVEFRLQTWIGS